MNGNSDKQKPLSPEELFRLLETEHEDALSGDALDDFEKEALEGFAAHTSADKARELTQEIHQLVSEKIGEEKKKKALPKFVWFAAAASLVLGIILSAYLLTQNAGMDAELALNKEAVVQHKLQEEHVAIEPLLAPADAKAVAESEKNSPAREAQVAPVQNGPVTSTVIDDAKALHDMSTGTAYAGKAENKPVENLQKDRDYTPAMKLAGQMEQETTKTDADVVSNTETRAVVVNSAPVYKYGAETKASKKETAVQEAQAPGYAYDQPVAIDQYKPEKTKQKSGAIKEKKGDLAEEQNAVEKSENIKQPAVAVPVSGIYIGGDKALKTDVSSWFKAKELAPVKGIYHIRVKLLGGGTVEVLQIRPGKNAEAEMLKPLKEALSGIKGWNSVIGETKAGENVVTFDLNF